jgi:hypothetical protein
VHVYGAGISSVVIAPDFFQELLPAEYQPAVFSQEGQQVELFG